MFGRLPMKLVKNRRLFDATLLAGAIILASVVLWAHAQERHDLPPFDYEKAKQLSREKRAGYERNLFNELSAWNTGSPKYMGKDGTNRREADWMAMADDGYELAYITLQVLQPSTGMRYAVEKPLARLSELADGGDAGAMCLHWRLIDRDPKGKEARYINSALSYVERGAAIGHPACLRIVGGLLLTGSQGISQDIPTGSNFAIRAEREGYGGAISIWAYLAGFSPRDERDWTRLYCWEQFAKRYAVLLDVSTVLSQLRDPLQKPRVLAHLELASKLEAWTPRLEECVKLGLGDN